MNPDANHDQASDSPAPGSATSDPADVSHVRADPPSAGFQPDATVEVHPGADINVGLKPDAAGDDAGDTAARGTSRPAGDAASSRPWDPAAAGSQPDTTPDVERAADSEGRLTPDATSIETTSGSEVGGRRSALRRRHQRRRRTARALRRRAPGAAPEVEVLTTCAPRLRHVGNELPRGRRADRRRARAALPGRARARRDDFARRSDAVFDTRALARRRAGVAGRRRARRAPRSCDMSRGTRPAYDWFVFFSYRYYHAFHGVARRRPDARCSSRPPSATRRSASAIFRPVFRGVRALMYNSLEERAMIQHVAGNHDVPGVVVGIGSEVPERTEPERFRQQFGITARSQSTWAASTRTRAARSCSSSSSATAARMPASCTLVLDRQDDTARCPTHPRIRHLGFLADDRKFDAMAAADVLIMPSYYESLSMVALEAWALGKPVLANGRCDVLKGQCLRSNAGLYYESYARVRRSAACDRVDAALRAGARAERPPFFRDALRWPVIERKYLDMFDRLRTKERVRRAGDGAAARLLRPRRRTLPAAAGRARRQRSGRRRSGHEASCRPPGARHARLRRRHRPRGARHPARAARGRLRLGDLRRDGGPAARGSDLRLSRSGRREPSRQPAAPSLLDRIARVAGAFALPDRMALIYHNITPPRVLRRRARAARELCWKRTPRAGRLRRPLRPGARRFGVQPAGARGARLPAHGRAAGGARLLASRRARRLPVAARSTTSGRTCCSWAASSPTSGSRTDPHLPRVPHRINPRSRLLLVGVVRRLRDVPGDAAGTDRARSGRPTYTLPVT